jgi:hypothetical protein
VSAAAADVAELDPQPALEALWGLDRVRLSIIGARIFGRGSEAPVDVMLSNGETLRMKALAEMAKPQKLMAEIAACAGVVPKLNSQQALHSVVLVRQLAEHEETIDENATAAEWGADYLQAATVLDVDLNDQAERWAAFSRLRTHDPAAVAREDARGLAACGIVLRHHDGSQLVRAGWFHQYVRTLDGTVGPTALGARMLRVGWTRRGASGRVKATAPGRREELGWNFWIVRDGWEAGR